MEAPVVREAAILTLVPEILRALGRRLRLTETVERASDPVRDGAVDDDRELYRYLIVV